MHAYACTRVHRLMCVACAWCVYTQVADEALLGYQLVSQIDYATGFLGAYGVILALIDRQLAAKAGANCRLVAC